MKHPFKTGATLVAFVCLFGASLAQAQPAGGPADINTSVVESVPQRLIIKYKSEGRQSLKAAIRQRVQERMSSMSSTPFTRLRQLATGADLFRPARKMQARDLEALAARLRQDPDVEYVEPDA